MDTEENKVENSEQQVTEVVAEETATKTYGSYTDEELAKMSKEDLKAIVGHFEEFVDVNRSRFELAIKTKEEEARRIAEEAMSDVKEKVEDVKSDVRTLWQQFCENKLNWLIIALLVIVLFNQIK